MKVVSRELRQTISTTIIGPKVYFKSQNLRPLCSIGLSPQHPTKPTPATLSFNATVKKPFSSFNSKFHKMLGKKLGSMKKLVKKVKAISNAGKPQPSHYECLLGDDEGGASPTTTTTTTPTGTFVIYVGEDRQRFVVPTAYLSHPLFKILLEKAYNEFGFDQRNGLVVPCSVAAFQEVVNAVECCDGKFDFGDLVEEFI